MKKNKVYLKSKGIEKEIRGENDLPNGVRLVIKGEGNVVKIGEDCRFSALVISIVNNLSSVIIGDRCCFHNLVLDVNSGEKQSLEIGKDTTFFGGRIVARDNSKIRIGEKCLFAAGLSMWATDGHTIFDLETKKVLNGTPESLTIGNHCWIGGSAILKNASLANDTVVAIQSVVTKSFDESNIVIGGNPAKILRYRFANEIIKQLLELKWWDLDDDIIKKIPYDDVERSIEFLKFLNEEGEK